MEILLLIVSAPEVVGERTNDSQRWRVIYMQGKEQLGEVYSSWNCNNLDWSQEISIIAAFETIKMFQCEDGDACSPT